MIKIFLNRLTNAAGRTWRTAFSPRYLFYTNATIGLTVGGGGDFINQNFEMYKGYKEEWLWSRSRNQCIQGMVFGATFHFWYIFLDKIFPGATTLVIFKKLLADQAVMVPVSAFLYLIMLNFLEGKNMNQAIESIKKKAGKLLMAEWTVGPTAQIINFYFLPTRFRVLYDSTLCMSFDAYYAYVKYERNDLKEIQVNGTDDDD